MVVQEAFETTFMEDSYFSSLTPTTNMGASAEGAEAVSVPPVPLGDLAVQGRPQSAKQPGRVRGNSPRRVKAAPPHHDGWGVAL